MYPYEVKSKFVTGSTASSDILSGAVQPLVDTIPAPAQPLELADGIWWIRLNLEIGRGLGHVNVYLLEDLDGWVLIDTGTNSENCRQDLEKVLRCDPFASKPLHKIFITHHHPDHLGLAGWLSQRGATVFATNKCWQAASEILTRSFYPSESQIAFQLLAGLSRIEIESYRRRRLHRYHDLVAPLPSQFAAIGGGDTFLIGSRTWHVHLGNGHAMDHATFWSEDGIAVVGDQILPGISPNLCVQSCEAGLDPVAGCLESCNKFLHLSTETTICMPGHNSPFVGVGKRCEQMLSNQMSIIKRIQEHLARPTTAVDCTAVVFGRMGDLLERPSLVAQVSGYLNYLQNRGVVRSERVGAVNLWSLV